MKYLFLFILLGLSGKAFCQPSPVRWLVSSEKLTDQTFIIRITGDINKSWYVYAAAAAALDLTKVSMDWDNEAILASDSLKTTSKPFIISDRVFKRSSLVFQNSVEFNQSIKVVGTIPSELKINIHGFCGNGKEFLPINEEKLVMLEGGMDVRTKLYGQLKLPLVHLDMPVADCGGGQKKESGIVSLFLLGMLGGFIALLTPCVFPMIPVTVSYFTNRSKTKKAGVRNAVLYGGFIFLIYLLTSLPFHLLGHVNPQVFNTISTNAWVNLGFFVVFIFFSLSFFGSFEIRAPSALMTKADSKAGFGSVAGIFFMALTLAIVSFSCTGPILGTLLVSSLSSNGGAWQLTAGMGGFGLALALPFALFALFPEGLKKLPRSGGWLDLVKKILAFVELALAFKFLSNADLVQHWGILKREVFIGIWILISAGLSLYLIILYKKSFPPSRLVPALGIMAISFTVYLFPGLTNTKNANLRLLSGFAPPLSYSLYLPDKGQERVKPNLVNDFENAVRLSKLEHKPILVDFTGWACVNCRKMEEQVWTKPEVSKLIQDKFILVSLYVDDRKKLPPAERFTYKVKDGIDKELTTVGDKWATFEAENFNQVTQPLYVMLSSDGQLLNHPVGYTPAATAYKEWLECGISANAVLSSKMVNR